MPVRAALTLDAKTPQDFPAGCDQEGRKWELPRRVGRLPRAGRHWRGLYQRRSIIERMFSSLKRSLLLEEHSCPGFGKVWLHVPCPCSITSLPYSPACWPATFSTSAIRAWIGCLHLLGCPTLRSLNPPGSRSGPR